MSPAFPQNNATDLRFPYAVLPSERGEDSSLAIIPCADSQYVSNCQFRVSVPDTSRPSFWLCMRSVALSSRPCLRVQVGAVPIAMSGSSLQHHVSQIVRQCTEKQVLGVTARRVVTFMANVHAFGVFVVRQKISYSVGKEPDLKAVNSTRDDAVSGLVGIAEPWPALISRALVNMAPKLFRSFQRKGWQVILNDRHNGLLVRLFSLEPLGRLRVSAACFI
jgi:hypothetical protein